MSLGQQLAKLERRIADLERRQESMIRHGKVAEVDPAAHKVRLKVGEDSEGKPQLSPWVSYAQLAGALKVHAPPTVGQNMTLMSAAGDMEQGIAVPRSWNRDNGAPSEAGDENVLVFGSIRLEMRGDEILLSLPRLLVEAGGSSFELTGEGLNILASFLRVQGDSVTHNDKEIGHTHKHLGVIRGGDVTEGPV